MEIEGFTVLHEVSSLNSLFSSEGSSTEAKAGTALDGNAEYMWPLRPQCICN